MSDVAENYSTIKYIKSGNFGSCDMVMHTESGQRV
jgi:hypothetical protein